MTHSKIKSLESLAEIAAEARTAGKTVALSHGVFDVIHLGHIRHLKEARSCGDMLIVTLTSDRYVNKGPGRPVFTAEMRAELMAALEYVDWVGINDEPMSTNLLRLLKPSLYVKGNDYADASADVTGGISDEQRAVEEGGGRLYFTNDLTFSSSSLINSHFGVYDAELQEYLDQIRSPELLEQVLQLVDQVAGLSVTLVGDTIIDEYQYVEPLGKSPKENMIATKYVDRELFAGGVIAAANHVADFCRDVTVITTLGTADSYEDLVRRSARPNVKLKVVPLENRPTVRKCRFLENGYMRKLFEIYTIDESPVSGADEDALDRTVRDLVGKSDLVIVTDFGHGMLTPRIIQTLEREARFLAVNTQTNSGNQGYNLITKYKRADYICIDAPEARLAMGDKFTDLGTVISEQMTKRIECPRMIVTQGKSGCTTYDSVSAPHHIPSFTKVVVDTVGAGDAFLAITSPLVAAGGDIEHVGFIGNAIGAIMVGIIGHRRSVQKAPLIKYLTALLK